MHKPIAFGFTLLQVLCLIPIIALMAQLMGFFIYAEDIYGLSRGYWSEWLTISMNILSLIFFYWLSVRKYVPIFTMLLMFASTALYGGVSHV